MAARHELPLLIESADLQGDLHVHTKASDGGDSLEKMAGAAQSRGLRYRALADGVLQRLDLVVVAVHGHFDLSKALQTRRILRALDRPYVSILAHPFGRLLGERPPYALDFERVLAAAHDRPCYLELNSQPQRLDLDDIYAKSARDRGVLLSIASDAHSADQLRFVEDGVRQARRGWLTKHDVLNARPLEQLRALLRKTMR